MWFHVDGLSSAHVYARIRRAPPAAGAAAAPPPPFSLDELSEDAVRDCAQLAKANSIEGCKKASVVVIYTLWSNLRKDGSMAAGAVSFHNERAVRRVAVGERDKEALSRLAKTRAESQPDLKAVRFLSLSLSLSLSFSLSLSLSLSGRVFLRPAPHLRPPLPAPPPRGAGPRAPRRKRARRAKVAAARAQHRGAQPRG